MFDGSCAVIYRFTSSFSSFYASETEGNVCLLLAAAEKKTAKFSTTISFIIHLLLDLCRGRKTRDVSAPSHGAADDNKMVSPEKGSRVRNKNPQVPGATDINNSMSTHIHTIHLSI